MAESEPPEEAPAPDPDDKKKVPVGWLGTNNPPPVQYLRPASIPPPESETPQVITKIIKEPSFTQNLYVEVRKWITSRSKSFWSNIRADVRFCGDAFREAFAQGLWSKMIAVLTHTNKWLNRVASVGVIAFIIGLYIRFIYPYEGNAGTAIVILSLLIFCSLVTIRVTRRLYEKTLLLHSETKEEPSSKVAANDDMGHQRNLIETWRGMVVLAERKYMSGKEPGISFSEIFQRQPAFIQLVPLLSKQAIDALDADIREESNRKERNRPAALRSLLAKEISRIETELELFPRLIGLSPQLDRKLFFEINKNNTSIRVEETNSALRFWLNIELRFENKDTYPVAFKHFDILMRRYGIKDQKPGFDVGIRYAFLRVSMDGQPIDIKNLEGMMIQERRLTPFYQLQIMIAVEDDQIERAKDLEIMDTIRLAMYSSGDQEPLVANLHPHWDLARERENGTHLMSITGVPTIEMDYRRLR